MKKIFATMVGFDALPTLAHDGHGWFGGHWHVSDAFGSGGRGRGAVLVAQVRGLP